MVVGDRAVLGPHGRWPPVLVFMCLCRGPRRLGPPSTSDICTLSLSWRRHCAPPCRYAYTLGLAGGVITNGFPVALRLNETTIADKLKVLGYQTHGFGKWDSKHRCDTPYSLI